MCELDEIETAIVDTARRFVDEQVKPTAHELERNNTYPHELIELMKQMGFFGLAVPVQWGGSGASASCLALASEELARGWMSLAGTIGGHSVVATLISRFGTEEQKVSYLPRMATGEVRAAMAMTETGGGSDLKAMKTVARLDGDSYVVNGSKTWISNARKADIIALLCRTEDIRQPEGSGFGILLVEKGPGLHISRDLPKLGYKGVESCEVVFQDFVAPSTTLLGTDVGAGFRQMMSGLELGRIQVAARALGVAAAALEDSLAYAQIREASGKPIWQHQSIGNYLADMATKLTAARQLTLFACRRYDAGRRSDMEAGMAKLFASEAAMEIVLNAVRIHGGYGYSTEFNIERYSSSWPFRCRCATAARPGRAEPRRGRGPPR